MCARVCQAYADARSARRGAQSCQQGAGRGHEEVGRGAGKAGRGARPACDTFRAQAQPLNFTQIVQAARARLGQREDAGLEVRLRRTLRANKRTFVQVGSTWQLRCLRAANEEEASSDDGGDDEPAPPPEPQGEDERDESESSEEEEPDVDDDEEDEALGAVQPQEQAQVNHHEEGTTECNPGGITYPLAKPAPEAPQEHGRYQVHSDSACPPVPPSRK